MGNQGFHGEARAPANKPSIVQERNKAAISYVNASTQAVSYTHLTLPTKA